MQNVSRQVGVCVLVEKNQMEWWAREGGVKFLKQIGLKYGQRVLDFGKYK